MNLSLLYLAIELLGWCFVALAWGKARSKPKCPTKFSRHQSHGVDITIVGLGASTVATAYFVVQPCDPLSMVAFGIYALSWLRFEANFDARSAMSVNRPRRTAWRKA